MNRVLWLVFFLPFYVMAADSKTLIQEGLALHDQGKYAAAIEKYKAAELLDKNNGLLQYELCFSSYANKEIKNAINYCHKSIKMQPQNNDGAFVLLGTIYDEMGESDSAVSIYGAGIKSNSKSYMLKYNIAITKSNMKKISEAYEFAKSATNDTKIHEGSYYTAGHLADQLGKWLDEYSYTMYSLLIGNTDRRIKESINRLYSINKSLVKKGMGDTVHINVPKKTSEDQDSTINRSFIFGMAVSIAADSVNEIPLYSEKINDYEFMVRSSISAINFLAEMNSKNSIKRFYEELKRNNFEEVFARYIYSSMSLKQYSDWKAKNAEKMKQFVQWFNNVYLKK